MVKNADSQERDSSGFESLPAILNDKLGQIIYTPYTLMLSI